MVRIRWPWNRKKTQVPSPHQENSQTQEALPRVASLAAAAVRRTREIIGKTGARPAGSQASRDAAALLHDDLLKVCGSTASQTFLMSVGAYAGWVRWVPVLYGASLIFAWAALPLLSLIISCVFSFYAVSQFIFFKPVGEVFPRKDEGVNVHGVIEPAGQVRRTIVFSGHHDSARLDRFSGGDRKKYMSTVFLPLICSFLLFALIVMLSIFSLLGFYTAPWESVPALGALVIATILGWWDLPLRTFFSQEASPGAGDNLVSSCTVVELARYFRARARRGKPLAGTRLVFASFDGEEVGVRGSRVWFERNKETLIAQGIQGYHFNIDCPYHVQDLSFLSTDANGTVSLSQSFATQCAEVAQGIGYDAHSQKIPFLAGATDAVEGARAGLMATTLMGVDWDDKEKTAPYHTLEDTPDAIDGETIEAVLAIAIKVVQTLDGEAMMEDPMETAKEEDSAPLRFRRLTKR